MQTPKKVSIHQEPDGPVYIYRWQDWGFSIVAVIGAAMLVGFIWMISLAVDSGAPLGVFLPFIAIFLAIGLWLAYWGLGRSINRSEIRLRDGRLIVRHKPLPWRYNADLAIEDITSVSQVTYYNRSKDRQSGFGISMETSYRNERLTAYTKDEKAHILIPKMELAAAKFLEQEIETGLGYRQPLEAAEQAAALETAKQEQRQVETRSVKPLIPLVIFLGILLIAGGIWLMISTFNSQQMAKASQSWPSAVGIATRYTIDSHTSETGNTTNTYYTADVEYTYLVNGKEYAIEKPIGESFNSQNEAAQYVETNIPEGTSLSVYYDPQKPSRALYDRTSPESWLYGMAAGMVVLGLLMIPLLLYMAREICRAEGCPDAWKHLEFWKKQVPILGHVGG